MIRILFVICLSFLLFLAPSGVGLAGPWLPAMEIENDAEEKEERTSEERIVIQSARKYTRPVLIKRKPLFRQGNEIRFKQSLSLLSITYFSFSLSYARDLVIFKQAFLI